MSRDMYSFVFKGIMAEEALDKSERLKYSPEAVYFSEDIARVLHFDEIDEKYVQQSKSMVTVYATITAFENATREFVVSVLEEKYDNWWEEGVQKSIREKANKRNEKEEKIRYHTNRGDEKISYVDFDDLPKIMTSQDNWEHFEAYLTDQEWVKTVFSQLAGSRNVLMHSGVLDDFDIQRIGLHIRDWIRQINV